MNVVDARTIARYSGQLETTVGRLPASVIGALLTLDPDPGVIDRRHHIGERDGAYQYFKALALSGCDRASRSWLALGTA
ncbi:hypothetical protein [Nocardioides sp. CFH 31398]|uniref:hypothetical protein n=1 Tax=Nocardioides sp. CFH 31398 TaxID=2919579 RepID=UPI001F06433F|nr:hypothetical protein [Nocardioides sp. CFH 31398]MCH1867010.1 hypothetical protein [Nocardioides sp. CFH 31398]